MSCPKHPKRGQNLQFLALSETTSIPPLSHERLVPPSWMSSQLNRAKTIIKLVASLGNGIALKCYRMLLV